MNKANVIRFMLDEVENEIAKFTAWNLADEKAKAEANKAPLAGGKFNYDLYYRQFGNYYKGRSPSRQLIKNNLKTVRRLALEIMQENEKGGAAL